VIPHLHVETPHALAHRVQLYAKPHFDKLHLRPYNRFEPEESEWWLTPAAANPAYCSTKLCFGRDLDEFGGGTGLLTVGLHAEKGLGEHAAEVYAHGRGAGWIMTADWHWRIFLKLVQTGRLIAALGAAGEALGQPMTFEIQAGYVQDPQSDFDPYSPLRRKDRAVYEYDAADAGLRLKWPADDGQSLLRAAPERVNSDALTALLGKLTDNPWVWVDCFVYAVFRRCSPKAAPDEVWDSEKVWMQYLNLLAFAVG
jgi:hypothetical protein